MKDKVHLQLKFRHDIDCSLSSVYRAKDAIGMSRKRSSKILWDPPSNDSGRKQVICDFVETIMDVPIQEVLFVDESSFDSRIVPYYGYSFKGEELKSSTFVCFASFHKNRRVLEVIQDHGKTPLYIPPYNPMFFTSSWTTYVINK